MWDKHYIGLRLTGFQDKGETRPVSRVTLQIDDETVVTAGDDTGLELTASCPHGTQAMAEAILAQVKGYRYRMYAADAASLDPAAELGDGITAGGVYSVISRLSEDGSGYPNAEAPGEAELEDEFPTSGPMTQIFNRKVAETRSEIRKTADSIKLNVTGKLGGTASIELKVGDREESGSVALSDVRQAFADDDSSITISAGTLTFNGKAVTTFNGNTFVVNSTNFGVTANGTMTAKAGVIGESASNGWNIGTKALYNGTGSMTSNATGTYIGTDGIRQYASGNAYVNIQNGVVTAEGANIRSGSIGGWTLTSNQLYNGTITENSAGNIGMSTANFTRTVAGEERTGLRFAIGANFGVSRTGVLYASGAEITGKMTATSGKIGGWAIESDRLSSAGEGYEIGFVPGNIGSASRVIYIRSGSSNIFSVFGDGRLTATGVTITGKVTADANSSLSGTLNGAGGTVYGVGGTVSGLGGTVSGMGGSLSRATLSTCTTNGTTLTVAGGSVTDNNGASVVGSPYASIRCGNFFVSISSGIGTCNTNFGVLGDFSVNGSKNRVMRTVDFGERLLEALETPVPTFTDYGMGTLDENGMCFIVIDPIFSETVNEAILPTVFLTKYGEGDIWAEEAEHDIVVIKGTPGLRFSWETRYAQGNAYTERLRVNGYDKPELSHEQDFNLEADMYFERSTFDCAQAGYEYYTEFERRISA